MVSATVTILDMGNKRQKRTKKGDGEKGRSPSYALFTRIPPELGAAFEAYVNSLRPRPTATSVVQTFIEDGLKAAGFWPPASEGDA